jgi:IclR family pca regulon transcriptional regulator
MTLGLTVGTKLPAIYTSMGRIMLGQISDDKLSHFVKKIEIEHINNFSIKRMNCFQE